MVKPARRHWSKTAQTKALVFSVYTNGSCHDFSRAGQGREGGLGGALLSPERPSHGGAVAFGTATDTSLVRWRPTGGERERRFAGKCARVGPG